MSLWFFQLLIPLDAQIPVQWAVKQIHRAAVKLMVCIVSVPVGLHDTMHVAISKKEGFTTSLCPISVSRSRQYFFVVAAHDAAAKQLFLRLTDHGDQRAETFGEVE